MGFLSSCGISRRGLLLVVCLWGVAGGIGLGLLLGGYRFGTGAGWQVALNWLALCLLFCTLLAVGWWGSRGFHPEFRGFLWGLAALAPVLALLVGWAAGGEYSGWRDQRAYMLVGNSMMYIVWAYLGVGLVYFVLEFSGILRERRSRGLSIWRSDE